MSMSRVLPFLIGAALVVTSVGQARADESENKSVTRQSTVTKSGDTITRSSTTTGSGGKTASSESSWTKEGNTVTHESSATGPNGNTATKEIGRASCRERGR